MTWGWGAVLVDTPPKDWCCPHCDQRRNARMRNQANFIGRHYYLFGEPRCTVCAHHFHAAVEHQPEQLGHEANR